MIIVHIKPFAAEIAVSVRSLTKALPDDTHIVVHGGRKNEMTTTEVKSKFPGQNARFIKQDSSQRSGNPFKVLVVLLQLSELLRKLMRMNRVNASYLHSFSGLQDSLYILKPFNSGYLNFSSKNQCPKLLPE